MTKRKLVYYGHPTLRKKAKPVTEFDSDLRDLAKELLEVSEKHHGMGLAANQVDDDRRIFFTQVPEENEKGEVVYPEPRFYVNPELSSPSHETWTIDEGCLSLAHLRVPVERPARIHVKAQDLDGNWFEEDLEGWQARCVMHENDHLNGVLTIDRVRGKDRKKLDQPLREIKKKYHN